MLLVKLVMKIKIEIVLSRSCVKLIVQQILCSTSIATVKPRDINELEAIFEIEEKTYLT